MQIVTIALYTVAMSLRRPMGSSCASQTHSVSSQRSHGMTFDLAPQSGRADATKQIIGASRQDVAAATSLCPQPAERRVAATGAMDLPRPIFKIHSETSFLADQKVIAVIDDDLGILESLELVLSSCGYHTELFVSAEEFLNEAPTLEVACLVTDIQLGDISGVELVRALCAQDFALPVIFITGSQNELHHRQAMELGCAAFLLKPFPAERLIETVRKAIGSKLN
jgi:CheY-like chemotaxis protein